MKNKTAKSLIAAAMLTSLLSVSSMAVQAWTPGEQIGTDTEVPYDSNFSGYSGPNQGNLINWAGGKKVTVTGTVNDTATFSGNTGVSDAGGALYNAWGGTTEVQSGSNFDNNTSNRGGAVWNNGKLNFIGKAIFTRNKATTTTPSNDMAGGAIVNSHFGDDANSGVLTFQNGVEFKNNTAAQGGAVKQGGTVAVTGGALYEGNQATNGNGGAVFNTAGWGEDTITRQETYDTLTAKSNTATGAGGAYYIDDQKGTLAVTGKADFQNNKAGTYGGAIYNNAGTVTVGDGSNFSGNKAESETFTTSGGAIYNNGGNVNIGNSATFTNNTVKGALDATVVDDEQGASGGAIASWNAGNVTIGNDAQFKNNGTFATTHTDGGAIYFSGDASTTEDKGVLTVGSGATFDNNYSHVRGGAIYNGDAIVKVGDNSTFSNNKSGSGGAVYQYQVNSANTKTEIGNGATFSKNTATDNSGGAIANFGGKLDIKNNVTFSENISGYAGGAIRNTGSATIGTGATFTENKAKADDYGGGAVSNSGTMTIGSGAKFEGNNAVLAGGAILNDGTLTIGGNSSFSGNNVTDGVGGAIYNAGVLTLDTTAGDITFSNNYIGDINDKDSVVMNDIYVDKGAQMVVKGGNSVILNSGLFTDGDSYATYAAGTVDPTTSLVDIEDNTNLVLNADSILAGGVNLGNGSSLENNAETIITGDITKNNPTDVANIINDKDATLEIAGTSTGVGLKNEGTAEISGSFTGSVSQKDKDATLTISDGATLSADGATIDGGSLIVEGDGALASGTVLTVTDAVKLQLASTTIDGTGLAVGDGHIKSTTGMNLIGADYKVSGDTLKTSVIITDGTINAATGDTLEITSGNTLTLSNDDNGTISDDAFLVDAGATLKLAPTSGNSLNLSTANKISGSTGSSVLVDEIVETVYDLNEDGSYTPRVEHKGVGTIKIASENDGFTGTFTQKMGNLIQTAGKFFAGDNTIKGGTVTIDDGAELTAASTTVENGTLNLQDGAIVKASTINITTGTDDNGNATFGTLNIYNKIQSNPNALGPVDEEGNPLVDEAGNSLFNATILASDIAGQNGSINYLNNGSTETDPVYAIGLNGGVKLGLFNGTVIDGDTDADGDGVPDGFTMSADAGVRDLTLGNGSGIYAENITLGQDTKLTYLDGAYIRDDSQVYMDKNSNLTFANEATTEGSEVVYTSVINSVVDSSTGLSDTTSVINKTGAGTTIIASALDNYTGSVNVTGGVFDLQNDAAISLNNITVDGAVMSAASEILGAAGNLSVTNGSDFNVDGSVIVEGNAAISGSQAQIAKDFISDNDITLTGSNVAVGGDLLAGNDALSTTGTLTVTGGLLDVQNDVLVKDAAISGTTVKVGGDFEASNSATLNNTNFTVLGDASLGDTTISGASVINLTNGAILNSLNLQGSSVINSPADISIANALTIGTAGGTDSPAINLTSGDINTIKANTVTLNTDAKISIDADPRSKTTDSIQANTVNSPSGAKLLISGINFTKTPIDKKVNIDISKVLTEAGSGTNYVGFADGKVTAKTEMGTYLLSASSSSNLVQAKLIELNPQMYRGQVATVSSYANQLLVNNMLLEHSNILANDLIARDMNANRYAAANPIFAPYQYSKKDGDLWYKAYASFERITMTQGLHVGNNTYGSIIGADFPVIELANGWTIVPTGYIAYNGGHQHFNGVSMYQDGGQIGAMGTAYKGNFLTSLLAYGGGYHNHMTVHGPVGSGSDDTGNWFAGVASKTAYNIHLPADFILQPTGLISYNIFGNQNYHSNFGNMSMSSGFLNGINVAPGVNLIWNKKTFSLYGTAQLVFNILGDVSGKAGNVDLDDVRMKTTYFEYGLGAMKRFKDTFSAYLQFTIRNGYRTGIGFQGGMQWKLGKKAKETEEK